jgi:hypothetical protein
VEGSNPLPDQLPDPDPPVQTGVPVAPPPAAPVIVIAPLTHWLMSEPASATGPDDQVTFLVSTMFPHGLVPETVKVSVPLPLPVTGAIYAPVKEVALFNVPVPDMAEYVQAMELYEPEAVAPVVKIFAVPQPAKGPPASPSTPLQAIVRVDVLVSPLQAPPVTATVSVAVNDPLMLDGVNVANAGLEVFCDQVPVPPLQVPATVVPVPVMDAPVIGIAEVPVHPEIFDPAVAVGVRFQVMVLLEVDVWPLHDPPVIAVVNVAVKLPLVVEGVKKAEAGLPVFWVHDPKPEPPVQVPVRVVPVPVMDAPVIVILFPTPMAVIHWLIADPAVAPGVRFQLKVLVRVIFEHPVSPFMVSVRVPLPVDEDVVKVAPVNDVELFTVPVPVPE